jgi:hypothetical protein
VQIEMPDERSSSSNFDVSDVHDDERRKLTLAFVEFDPKPTCAFVAPLFTACSLTHSTVGRACQTGVKPSCGFWMIQ